MNDVFDDRLLAAVQGLVAPISIVAHDGDFLAAGGEQAIRARAHRVLVEFELLELVEIVAAFGEQRFDHVARDDDLRLQRIEHDQWILLREVQLEHDAPRILVAAARLLGFVAVGAVRADGLQILPDRRDIEALVALAQLEGEAHVPSGHRLAVVPARRRVQRDFDRVIVHRIRLREQRLHLAADRVVHQQRLVQKVHRADRPSPGCPAD